MLVVQRYVSNLAILTPSVVVSQPLLDLHALTQYLLSFCFYSFIRVFHLLNERVLYYAGTRDMRALGSTGVKTTSRDIAQINATISRAIAATTTLRCLPRCMRR